MTCPELVSPNPRPRRVEFSRYELLHVEGKQLISGWFRRAWAERDCRREETFEPFIFSWFAFNAWAACVTDIDTDREIIDALASDQTINTDFLDLFQNNPSVSEKISSFSELLPIFDVKSLRRTRITRGNTVTRRDRVLHYLAHGANRFEPSCWQRHYDAGQAMPIDWAHIIKAIYKVRCNLFHGLKDAHSEMDQIIVHSAFMTLIYFLDSAGYLYG